MYTIGKLSCLLETVGIIGVAGTDYEPIASSLNPSTALLQVNDVHPLITSENINNCFANEDTLGTNEYSELIQYKKEQVVIYDGKYYRAIQDGINQNPASATTYWVEISLVSYQLSKLMISSANKLMMDIFDSKQVRQTVSSILDDFYLFNGRGDISNINPNLGRLVGFRIDVKEPKDIRLVVKKIALHFAANSGTINLKLYHSSKFGAPVATFNLSYDTPGQNKWFDVSTCIMDYVSTTNDAGGTWYLVYNEANTPTLQSVRKELDIVTPPSGCASCNMDYHNQFAKRSRYVSVQPFYVNSGNFTDGELWDEGVEIYVNENNFGLNLSMTAECDLSDFICRNKEQFANALGYRIAVDILQQFCYSPRLNQVKQNVSSDAHYALHGDKNTNTMGLVHELENKVKAISFSISDLNPICLPCENKKKIRYKAI